MLPNIHPHSSSVSSNQRERLFNQSSKLFWFTGLSGSGKSTLANALELKLYNLGYKTYVLDGDNLRGGLNSDLDFTNEGRKENIRRAAEVSKLFLDAGIIVLGAFISPFSNDRMEIMKKVGNEKYIEIFVDCPVNICELRDVKGLYQKARDGKIKNFTSKDSIYENPLSPNLTIHSNCQTVEQSVDTLLTYVVPKISCVTNEL